MINIKYCLSILCTILLTSTTAQAQYSLRGRVIAQDSQKPIEGVEIFDNQSQTIKVTDEEGVYLFNHLSSGTHYFTVFAIGYQSITDSININGHNLHVFELPPLSLELSGIEIAAQREELFAIKQLKDVEGTAIFAGKKSEVVVMDLVKGNKANNNGRQVYAQVAGLNIYEGNEGGLQLNLGGRGLDPNRTSNFNTRQNGYDISADVLGYPENYYSPPSEAIDEIRIIRGASSLQYGTQFGGLIDFKLRKTPSFKPVEIITNQTISSYGAFNSFNSIGINKGKFSLNTFYNYKKGNGYRNYSKYTANNVFLATDYAFSDDTKIGFEFTYFKYLAQQAGGLTDQQFADNPRQSTRDRNWFKVDWKLYNLYFNHSFSPATTLSLSIFGLDADRKSVGYRGNPINLNENPITAIDEQDELGNYILPRDLILGAFQNYGAEIRLLTNYTLLSKKSVLLIGSKYYQSNNTSIQGAGSLSYDADFDLYNNTFPDYPSQSNFRFPNRNLALFVENIFYLSDKLSITPGIRLEHIKTESDGTYNQVVFDNAGNAIANNQLADDKILNRHFALLGVGLSYKKSKKIQLVANLSQNYRSVTFSDIRVVSPTFIVDPNINDERGLTGDFGIKGRIGKVLSYDFTTYGVVYNDRIGIILDDRANRVRKNIGKALIAGTESLINVNFARWISPESRDYTFNYFVNTAYTYSKYLASVENNVVGKKVEFIPTINLKTGLSGGYKNLNLAFQFTYLSKQFTDVQNSTIATDGDKRSGIVGEIPAYHIADLTLSYEYKQFKIESGINNLFDKAYFTRRATGYPGPGIIPSDGRSFFATLSFRY